MAKEVIDLNHTPGDLPEVELAGPLVEKIARQSRFRLSQKGEAHKNFERSRRNGEEKRAIAQTLIVKYPPRDRAIQFQLATELSPEPDLNVPSWLIPESDSTTPLSINDTNPVNLKHLEPLEEDVDPEVLEVLIEDQDRIPLSLAHLQQRNPLEDDYSEDSQP